MDKAAFYKDALSGVAGPLAGVRVVDVTMAWSGPMASCLLADLGCDVIRVEPPGVGSGFHVPPNIPGTSLSFGNETIHRNKRSMSLDVRVGEGRELFLSLVQTADVVLENFKPGTMAAWGVGYEDCRQAKPDIVYVSLSGWGQYGPSSDRGGYDPVALAASGWMSLNGSPEGPPVKAPTYLTDDLAGLHSALGALAALHYRNETGSGQHVDVSMLDALLFQSNGLLTLAATGYAMPRWGNELGVTVPCNTYACTDGYLYLAVGADRQWRKLADLIGCSDLAAAPEFATNIQRIKNRDAVNQLIADWCADKSTQDAVNLMAGAGLAVAPVQTYLDAARNPHVLERDMLIDVELSDGSTAPLTGPAVKFSRTPTTIRNSAPRSGAQTNEILVELGVDDDQMAKLKERGVI